MNPYLIIIPAYNEENSIATVIDEIHRAHFPADILVVNDGSTDNTSRISRQKDAMVLDIPFNIGYGGALQTGFRLASDLDYEFVITMDGDAQHDPSTIQNLLYAMDREKADVVIGSRFLHGTYKMGFVRKTGVRLFSAIARWYTGTTFTDPTSGFQLLNRRVFSCLAKGDNYTLDYPDVNIIMALHKMKFKVVEAPVKMIEKPEGKSMHAGLKPVFYVLKMSLAILMVLLRRED